MKKYLLSLCLLLASASSLAAADVFRVRQVSDGDTLVLENAQKIRLIGIDTPEMSDDRRNRQNARRNHLSEAVVGQYAEKAKQFVREQVEGRDVRLEYDWQRKDKYGRTLAYVYREPDGYFLNEEVLKEGYGFFYGFFPFRHRERFRNDADLARKEKRGLWK